MNPQLQFFGTVFEPQEAQEPILARPLRDVFLAWLTEIWAADELEKVGIQPRRRAIFAGPPGTGKTTLAHHLSARLGMRMLLVGPEKINSKYVSASAEQIGRLFDCLAKDDGEPIVLFFDEFDSVASKRMDSGMNKVGEQDHNLMINTLLARMDRYEGIIIAASNFENRMDEAVWRRFELQVSLELPGQREIERIFARYIYPFILTKEELQGFGVAFATASPALIRQFCESIKRNIVVGPMANWDMGKNATINRILESVKPHPELGKPRLWSHGSKDLAIQNLEWPLVREMRQGASEPEVSAETVDNVVSLGVRQKGGGK